VWLLNLVFNDMSISIDSLADASCSIITRLPILMPLQGVQKLSGENLIVVRAELSTLS
jgi:hypothetical protein